MRRKIDVWFGEAFGSPPDCLLRAVKRILSEAGGEMEAQDFLDAMVSRGLAGADMRLEYLDLASGDVFEL